MQVLHIILLAAAVRWLSEHLHVPFLKGGAHQAAPLQFLRVVTILRRMHTPIIRQIAKQISWFTFSLPSLSLFLCSPASPSHRRPVVLCVDHNSPREGVMILANLRIFRLAQQFQLYCKLP